MSLSNVDSRTARLLMGLAVSGMQTLFSNWHKTTLVSRPPLSSFQKLPFTNSLIFIYFFIFFGYHSLSSILTTDRRNSVSLPFQQNPKQDRVSPLPDVSANQSLGAFLSSFQSNHFGSFSLVCLRLSHSRPFPLSLA